MLDCEGVITPPIALCDINKSIHLIRFSALLHTDYVRCSRVILCLCLIFTGFLLGSCEQYDDANQKMLEAYFVESQGLKQVPLDSIRRFSAKVDEWTNVHPEAQKEEIYAQIQQNIHTAMVTIRLELEDSWDEEENINFDFGHTDGTDGTD